MNIDELIDALYNEPDLDKRRYIPDKLAKLGDWKSTIPLGELIIDDSQPGIMRNEAVESLGKQGDPRAIEFLIQVLDNPDEDMRRTAVWSLGQIGVPKTLAPVFSMTDDPSVEVRRWVAKSAGRIRTDKVINELRQYYESIELNEERVLADIIRALSSQVNRIPSSQIAYWIDQGHTILSADVRNYVKQAVMILLNLLYEQGATPDVSLLATIFSDLPQRDPLVRPLIIDAMGHASNIEFLEQLEDPVAIKAMGIANNTQYLETILKSSPTDEEIIAVLEGYTFTEETPDLSQYYDHDNLTIQTHALQLHAIRGYPIQKLHDLYEKGQGIYKLLEIYRYYGKDAIEIFKKSALEADKVARQNSVYSLISPEMIGKPELHEYIKPILEGVAKQDRIWHIRRDARIGLERIQQS